ncbi:PhzF family phenazine biosynthesis protein [Glacieibacterium sp.]|uniref:PhzF family phenazine biosynthesis protein n=1 Tax=Glacieibacterium sp. TaxID=2860237 RepID=UPI003B0004E8
MHLPFHQIDAFADGPFSGNPAAVMPLSEWLPDDTLLAIAAEHNLSETAFIVPNTDGSADFDLRWFTPTIEVALCGHATLASGHFMLADNPGQDSVTFSTRRSGILTVSRDGDRLALSLPVMPPHAADVPGLAEALGATPEATLVHGEDYIVAVFATAAEIHDLAPDFRAIAALKGGDVLCIVTAPGEDTDIVSRAFAPGAGIDEDPVTGSAHAIVAPYWAARLGRDSFTAYQASKRGGDLHCTLAGDRVIVSGTCVTVIEGVMLL